MATGKIGVSTQNLFPIIKSFFIPITKYFFEKLCRMRWMQLKN